MGASRAGDLADQNRGPGGTGRDHEEEDSLGKLVTFLQRPRTAPADEKPSGDAKILIFTGVRYERGTPPPPTTTANPSGGKRSRV